MPARPRPLHFAALLSALVASTACGDGGETASTSGEPTGGGAGGGCPSGALVGPDGDCHPIGIQGCDARFLGDDGLCRPTLAACERGSIPKFDEGCVKVGIPSCSKDFVGEDGFCHPRAARCPPGAMALPVEGCVGLDGGGCGSGTWGSIPDGGDVRHVDPTYTGGASTGSRTAPFTTLRDALDDVPPGGTVALAAGTYHEFASIGRDVTIQGRCASMVTIDGGGGTDAPNTLEVDAGTVAIKNLTLKGDGVGIYALSTTVVDGVVIDGVRHFGISAEGARVTIENTLIKETRTLDATGGIAVYAQAGSDVTLSRSGLLRNQSTAFDAKGPGAKFAIEDVSIEDTLPLDETGQNGEAVLAQAGASGTLKDVAITGSHLDALEAFGVDSEIRATNVVVELTLPQASDGYLGAGVQLYQGAKMTVSGSAFLDNSVIGILVSGATLDLDTTIVAGTKPLADGSFGRGLEAQDLAVVKVVDSVFVGNTDIAVLALGATRLDLDGVLVEDTLSNRDGTFGVGLFVDDRSVLTMNRSAVSRSRVAGAVIAASTATIQGSLFSSILAGTIILQNPPKTIPDVGDGLLAMLGGAGAVVGASRIEGCARAGVLFDGGSGAVNASSSTNNRFGLVLEGETTATRDGATNLDGNTERAEVDDGMLPVPNRPAAMPK